MKTKYKVSKEVRSLIRAELTNFKSYEKKRKELEIDIIEESKKMDADGSQKTNKVGSVVENKAILLERNEELQLLNGKIESMKRAYNRLLDWEFKIAKRIFDDGCTQIYLEMHERVPRKTYYGVASKIIYFTAKEYKLI